MICDLIIFGIGNECLFDSGFVKSFSLYAHQYIYNFNLNVILTIQGVNNFVY